MRGEDGLMLGVSTSLEGSQDESGVVAWVGATTLSTLLEAGSMALDMSYGAVGRLCKFNSCIFPLPLFRLVLVWCRHHRKAWTTVQAFLTTGWTTRTMTSLMTLTHT